MSTDYSPSFETALFAISDELDNLAAQRSPAKIAEFLKKKGISGKCAIGTACPLHTYLEPLAGGYVFKVTATQTCLYPRDNEPGSHIRFGIPNPMVIAEFVEDFDKHRYPDLEIAATP